eukprot:TRINITY_DN1657_c0_g1_i1.p1 TRINITY_DN1657_c0_g1~~TRINITY_DN1657_c0_g1_i1.p1  ORF type:complete len:1026 (-),score=308.16 TRINITY_DN1657_c0_g1_i1:215-3259(-)
MSKDEDDDYQLDEHDESDGDFEEDPQPKSKKQKTEHNLDVSSFLDLEAEVSDDDEDGKDEVEYDEEDLEFITNNKEVEDGAYADRNTYYQLNKRMEDNVDDLVRGIHERHKNYVQSGDDYDDEELGKSGPTQAARQPTNNDPKLWLVKCKPGSERFIVSCVMRKAVSKYEEGQPLQIYSSIALDHLKGYIYVEAYKEAHVREAVFGIEGVWLKEKVMLVVKKEMVTVLSVPKKKASLQKNSWVRIKRGVYHDDIAQVVSFDDVSQVVLVRLIPRIDIDAWLSKAPRADDDDDQPKKKRKIFGKDTPRPPAKFFNSEELKRLNGGEDPVDHIRDTMTAEPFEKFDNNLFKDGFLHKKFSLKNLIHENVIPTFEESQKFEMTNRERSKLYDEDDELPKDRRMPKSMSDLRRPVTFLKGDDVIVIEGELKNLVGTVQSMDGDNINILPRHDELKDILPVPKSHVQKYFLVGDHVKVLSGNYQDETGMIVKLSDGVATIMSDISNREIKAIINDIRKCAEVSSGLKLGEYSLHDLVQLDQNTIAVIVRIERDSAQLLDTNDNVKTLKLQGIRKRIKNQNAVGRDSKGNGVGVGDQVQVINGKYQNERGVVKHVYRAFLFVYSNGRQTNGGVFSVRAKSCQLLGESKNKTNSMYKNSQVTVRGQYGFGKPARKRRNDELLHQNVYITKGPWKGYLGMIKDTSDTHVTVQLQTNAKRLQIPRSDITKAGEKQQISLSDWDVTKTPMRGDQTPLRPQTPRHFPSTPSSDPWNPAGGQTPRHPSSEDDEGISQYASMHSKITESLYPATPKTPKTSNYGTPYAAPTTPAPTPNTPAPNTPAPATPATMDYPTSNAEYYAATPHNYTTHDIPATPAEANSPMPGTVAPTTPFPGEESHPYDDDDDEDRKFLFPDVIANIDETYDNGRYKGALCVIREVDNELINVSVLDANNNEGESLVLNATFLLPAKIETKDTVVITKGPFQGRVGTLRSIMNNNEAIFADEKEIKTVTLDDLAKFYRPKR